jgi:hypothetical protein
MFFRIRTSKDGKRQYLYAEKRWRENGKVKPKSTLIGRRRPSRSGPSSPGLMVPFLPVTIAHELATGARLEEMKAKLAKRCGTIR